MKILAIETSCDETAISIVDAKGGMFKPHFTILSNQLLSQAEKHAKYGGVFPNLAKREHSKSITPLLKMALKEANLYDDLKKPMKIKENERSFLEKTLAREPALFEPFIELISSIKKPKIDAIAVTAGPGLEPALWVGINTAKALAHVWNLPLLPINHMEGHIVSSMLVPIETAKKQKHATVQFPSVQFPVLGLLISGGHTELVLMKNWLKYKNIGETRDDAVGEAFDKVARMMQLPYPGGPEISKLASTVADGSSRFSLPRPMLHSNDYDFSFSGIKTAVLYTLREIPRLTQKMKAEIANEFENAITEVLLSKTMKAAKEYNARSIVIGGGVSANKRIRSSFTATIKEKFTDVDLYLPPTNLSTDNALMIATAAYFRVLSNKKVTRTIKANGNLSL